MSLYAVFCAPPERHSPSPSLRDVRGAGRLGYEARGSFARYQKPGILAHTSNYPSFLLGPFMKNNSVAFSRTRAAFTALPQPVHVIVFGSTNQKGGSLARPARFR